MSTELEAAIDSLVPSGPRFGDWDDVLARAGVSRARVEPPDPRPAAHRRRVSRRAVLAVVLLALLVALLATPAFGIQGFVLDLFGRKNVSFANSKSAPNEVKKQFEDLAIGAPARWAPQVIARQARVVATFSIAGHQRKLWVAPTRRGGYCYTFEHSFGGCRQTSPDRQGRFSATWQGMRNHPSFVSRVGGDITEPAAARITATYADGTTADIPFVWISKPIAAGFFMYDIPTVHWSKQGRLVALTLSARDGRRLGRQTFAATPRSVPRPPLPSHMTGPKERSLPAHPPVAPSTPLQRGSADGFSVVAGHNGAVQFTQTGSTAILRRLVDQSAGFGCFRLTREFGIFTVRGLGEEGRFASSVGVHVGGVGTPFDGCEVQSSAGHRWPDAQHGHAAAEIPLTAAGRAFFADRAAARDLALFLRSRRMHRLRAEQPEQALADIRRVYGSQLSGSSIRIERDGDALRFAERSPGGREFSVLVRRGRITRQNLKPFAFVF